MHQGFSVAEVLSTLDLTELLKRGPNFPHWLLEDICWKIITDFKAKMWLLNIFLKKFILHLKTKKMDKD